MNTIGFSVQPHLHNPQAYSSASQVPAGLENSDAKESLLPPVEQPAQSATVSNQNDSNAGIAETNSVKADDQNTALLQQQQRIISSLAARDREVRAHERAHASVGGLYAGATSYQYTRGPDGVNYAVSGEVAIALPRYPSDPQATLQAAQQVRSAALAPADPSAQDLRVAAAAASIALDAAAEIAQQRQAQLKAEDDGSDAQSDGQTSSIDDKEEAAPQADDAAGREALPRSSLEKFLALASLTAGQEKGQLIDSSA